MKDIEIDYKKLYEEEHERYEGALERARGHHSVASHYSIAKEIEELEHIFPELAESEDEKIRKELIEFFNQFENGELRGVDITPWIAWLEKQGHDGKKWIYEDVYLKEKEQLFQDGIDEVLENPQKYGLEKQGEQKPTDTPKFKVGDWVVNNNGEPRVFRVEKQDWPDSIISGSLGNQFINTDTLNKQYHLWTIQDAKDGDVLEFADHGRTVIGIVSYVNKVTGKVDVNCLLEGNNFKLGNYYALDTIKPHPATKEQRDLLFQKMKEAGYEWNEEKKELNMIEQNPTWSEEDDKIFNKLMKYLDLENRYYFNKNDYDEAQNWIKSIKERMQLQ